MIKVGITGGIGSGKSIICKVFEKFGVPVYYADQRAKYLMGNSLEIKKQLVEKFGTEVFLNDRLNKPFLANLIFHDEKSLAFVNSVVHPEVAKDFECWSRNFETEPYVIEEAALLFESGAYRNMDKLITIYSPIEIRYQRVMKRDNVSRQQVLDRMKNQLSEEEKLERSDFVIYNDEKKSILKQVLTLHHIFNPSYK